MKNDESVKEMYNCMKKITNQIKSLGGDKWGDHEIVDKLLTVYMARDVTLPSLIRAERGLLGTLTMRINPQAYGYHRSFPREYSRVSYP